MLPRYSPKVGDYRISKAPTEEGFFWCWQYQIDGTWIFSASKSEQAERDFVANKRWLNEDTQYDYWREVSKDG